MPKKRKTAAPAKPWRLIRYLSKGDRLVVKGVRGKRVKSVRAGRKYVLEVRRGGKLRGYVNNVVRTKDGYKPVAKEFTLSMLNRVKHTKEHKLKGQQERSLTFTLTNKKRIKYQIPAAVIREIQGRKGVAFGFEVKLRRSSISPPETFYSPFVYTDGKLKEEYLKKTIVSNLLRTINSNRYRMSPLLKDQTEHKKITRAEKAQVTLIFEKVGKTHGATGSRRLCPKCKRSAHKGKCPKKRRHATKKAR